MKKLREMSNYERLGKVVSFLTMSMLRGHSSLHSALQEARADAYQEIDEPEVLQEALELASLVESFANASADSDHIGAVFMLAVMHQGKAQQENTTDLPTPQESLPPLLRTLH